MPILKTAPLEALKGLLDLYPAVNLQENWPEQADTKEELSRSIAASRRIEEIERFADEYLSCCKQHVYVFSHKGTLSRLPEIKLPDAQKFRETVERVRVRLLYLIKAEYVVFHRDTFKAVQLEFLWPAQLEFTSKHLIVRFVILEKDIKASLAKVTKAEVNAQEYSVISRGMTEKAILQQLRDSTHAELRLEPTDLHKGVKELWELGFMDCFRVRFKKKISTASEWMDEAKGIKQYNQALYKEVVKSEMFYTLFQVSQNAGSSVSIFSVDPPNGYIVFPRYSTVQGDSNHVVDEIIRLN